MKVYIDTSVLGGFFEKEFSETTKALFKEIEKGEKKSYISEITIAELEGAPENVKDLYNEFKNKMNLISVTEKMFKLKEKYIEAKAISRKYETDALHIAIATVLKLDAIVSWNFKHIVNLYRIKIYNKVNKENGYPEIEIRTPSEVIKYK